MHIRGRSGSLVRVRPEWLSSMAPRAHLADYVNAGLGAFLFGGGAGGVTCPCDAARDASPTPPSSRATQPSPSAPATMAATSAPEPSPPTRMGRSTYRQGIRARCRLVALRMGPRAGVQPRAGRHGVAPSSSPRDRARAAIFALLETPNFTEIDCRCARTVFGDTTRASAISLLEQPAPSRRTTSASRRVSRAGRASGSIEARARARTSEGVM